MPNRTDHMNHFRIIRPNNCIVEKLNSDPKLKLSARESVVDLIKVANEHVQYVKCEEENSNLIQCHMHPLIQAAHIAYSSHLPLVLTPDLIWYCVTSGFATHIYLNSEELRNKFVDFEGKKKIEIRRDDFALRSLDNSWHEVIDEFCTQIKDLTHNDVAEKILPDFSTTTENSKIVSQIVLMDSMQKYFDYHFTTLCAIPEIRLEGRKYDWEDLMLKANILLDLIPELSQWKKALNEILQPFIDVYNDEIDVKFWNEIYKVGGGSGGPYISGWLVALFPYLSDNQKNPFISEVKTWKNTADKMCEGLTTADFKYHMNQVPFIWNYYGNEVKMLFVGGLIGVKHDETDQSLKPVFGYAVAENKIKTPKKDDNDD